MLYKNQRLDTYITKYSWKKIKEEMDKLILSPQLRKQATDLFLESFEIFSYVEVDREH